MAHTKYICNHEWGKGPEKFHLATCPQVIDLERYMQRDTVGTESPSLVINRSPVEVRMRPNLGYSDYREALIEQGFRPCAVCKP
jgi:hypothetical protein